ncbi:MAG TPA: hypothetical protein VN256_12910 [Pyrinomonadaceae bacterium]|nr:hypothetical protein [Pyrinomonadaceae bacterium]
MSDEQKQRRQLDQRLHENINERQRAIGAWTAEGQDKFEHWLYESRRVMSELRRLPILFARERNGELPKAFKYCSLSPVEQLPAENKLVCCLGQEVRACEILRDTFKNTDEFPPEVIDQAKAHVCVTHILAESARHSIDTSEGYVLDETDRQFWQRTYAIMAMPEPVPQCEECGAEVGGEEIDDSEKVGSILRCRECLAKVGMV